MYSDIQFSYLSSVLFFLSEHKEYLLSNILINHSISCNHHLYAFRLFSNGQYQSVLVDDVIPTHRDQLQYTVLKGKEIWPIILEKAWCKQIGSYEAALGLSPEDCFEEILGAPAYSYMIQTSNKQSIFDLMNSCLNKAQWLCVVARKNLNSFKNNQVFQVHSIQHAVVLLTSPYTDFKYEGA